MAEHEPGKPWGTVELAERAGVDDSRIRQLLLAGQIDGYRMGPIWIIPDQAARAWLESREKETTK